MLSDEGMKWASDVHARQSLTSSWEPGYGDDGRRKHNKNKIIRWEIDRVTETRQRVRDVWVLWGTETHRREERIKQHISIKWRDDFLSLRFRFYLFIFLFHISAICALREIYTDTRPTRKAHMPLLSEDVFTRYRSQCESWCERSGSTGTVRKRKSVFWWNLLHLCVLCQLWGSVYSFCIQCTTDTSYTHPHVSNGNKNKTAKKEKCRLHVWNEYAACKNRLYYDYFHVWFRFGVAILGRSIGCAIHS